MAVPDTTDESPSDRAIVWIAAFKLVKGVLLIAVAVGALKLLHHDVADTLTHLVQSLRADPDNHFIHKGLTKLGGLTVHGCCDHYD